VENNFILRERISLLLYTPALSSSTISVASYTVKHHSCLVTSVEVHLVLF